MQGDLTSSVALVTGANRGLGREVAHRLAELGMPVVIGSRRLGEGQSLARDLKTWGLAAEAVGLYVTEPDSARRAAAAVGAKYGRLDVLVNNAGLLVKASAAELSVTALRST
ncbi:3-oxoacyl-[acyl-carrier-protein] reductase FabG [Streptomyces sp. MBT84]|nr:3-oxoacyl-[acyl-carrier-protein] reductase FabG [Streptomyces sp. MBT84]